MFEKRRQDQKDREVAKTREWVDSMLMGNRSWGVIALGKYWICPLCATIAAEFEKRADLPDAAFLHLQEHCTPFQAGQREPRVGPGELETMARALQIKAEVKSSALWQQRDSRGRWYCPYCARETDVLIPASGTINVDILTEIVVHVERCFAYEHGTGRIKTLAEVQKPIQAYEAYTKTAAMTKQKAQTDPVWQVKDAKGHWICPYCRQAVTAVDISTRILMTETAPFQMATHLSSHCAAWREKRAPATVADLEALVRVPAAPGAAAKGDDDPNSSRVFAEELMDKVKKEVASLKGEQDSHTSMRKGVEEAGKRQKTMLSAMPKIPGFEFQVLFKPSDVVAGDFYDFPRISEDEIGILIGDVSGHGIEAGMVMALMRKVISIHARGTPSPKETLSTANADIYPDLDRNVFATVCYCVLNTRTRRLLICRAGHNPVLIHNLARGPQPICLEPRGMAVGMDSGPRFESLLEEASVDLQPGDMIMLYTDGVNEQMNEKEEEFGLPRLLDTMAEYGNHEVKYLLHMTDLTLTEFRGPKRKQDDDITMIGIRVL